GAVALRGEVDLAALRLQERDHVAEGLPRERRIRHEDVRDVRYQGHRQEVFFQVVAELAVEAHADGVRGGRGHEQRVAVRGTFRHGFGADVASGAGAIVD